MYSKSEVIDIPIAHNEGNFFADNDTLKKIKDNDQIIFKYCNDKGITGKEFNPNGSIENIAGIINKDGNVLGMMPHPERATCQLSQLNDGERFFSSITESIL